MAPKTKNIIISQPEQIVQETIEDIINNKDYIKIEKYIVEVNRFYMYISNLLFNEPLKTVEEITKKNKIYLDAITKMREMFKNLKYLYDKIPYMELIENLHFKDYTATSIKTNFIGSLKNIFGNEYKRFTRHFNKEIPKDKWNGIYIAWLFDTSFPLKESNMKIKKFVFPELFEEYPFEDLLILLNVDGAITEKIKERRRETDDDYCTDDSENYFWNSDNEND